jgi:hypothetical protein
MFFAQYRRLWKLALRMMDDNLEVRTEAFKEFNVLPLKQKEKVNRYTREIWLNPPRKRG